MEKLRLQNYLRYYTRAHWALFVLPESQTTAHPQWCKIPGGGYTRCTRRAGFEAS